MWVSAFASTVQSAKGQRLSWLGNGVAQAQALGSPPFTQLFAARLAEITTKRGDDMPSGLFPIAGTARASTGGLAPVSQRILQGETQVAAADSLQMSGQRLAALEHLAAAAEQLLLLLPAGGSPGAGAEGSRKATRSSNKRTPSPDRSGQIPSDLCEATPLR